MNNLLHIQSDQQLISQLLGKDNPKAVEHPTFVIVNAFFAAPVIVVSVKTVINRPLSPTVSSSEGCTTLCVWGNLTYGKPSYHHLLVFPTDKLMGKVHTASYEVPLSGTRFHIRSGPPHLWTQSNCCQAPCCRPKVLGDQLTAVQFCLASTDQGSISCQLWQLAVNCQPL